MEILLGQLGNTWVHEVNVENRASSSTSSSSSSSTSVIVIACCKVRWESSKSGSRFCKACVDSSYLTRTTMKNREREGETWLELETRAGSVKVYNKVK